MTGKKKKKEEEEEGGGGGRGGEGAAGGRKRRGRRRKKKKGIVPSVLKSWGWVKGPWKSLQRILFSDFPAFTG